MIRIMRIVEVSTFRNILKAGVFLCLFGKLIVGIRVCKNTAEVSEKRKIGFVFSVVSVENTNEI